MREVTKTPLIRLAKRDAMDPKYAMLIRLGAILLALVIGSIPIVLTGVNPVKAYGVIIKGSVSNSIYLKQTIKIAIPLLVCSLAIGPCFKMKFWNIGAEGQLTFGAICSAFVAINLGGKIPSLLCILLMALAGAFGGGLWGFLPGFFKAKFNTNETLFTLMMNYIAIGLGAWLQGGPWEGRKGTQIVPMFDKSTYLPEVFGVQCGWIVALLLVVFMHIYMNYTKHGYEVAVIGDSVNTARYAGMNVGWIMMRTMILSTNGTLLTLDRARSLAAAGMGVVSVSIDGLEDTHEVIRGVGSYRRALEGLANARAAGFYDTEAITCVRPANLPQLPQLEKELRAAGCNLWRLITIDAMGRAGEPDDIPQEILENLKQNSKCSNASKESPVVDSLWLDPESCREMFRFLKRRKNELAKNGDDFQIQFSCGGFLGVREEEIRPVDSIGGQCAAGLAIASILYDGSISACPSLPRDLIQGNARTERVSEVWRKRFKPHRDFEARRVGPCADCSWFDLCLGGGLHERLAQPDDFCWIKRTAGQLL